MQGGDRLPHIDRNVDLRRDADQTRPDMIILNGGAISKSRVLPLLIYKMDLSVRSE